MLLDSNNNTQAASSRIMMHAESKPVIVNFKNMKMVAQKEVMVTQDQNIDKFKKVSTDDDDNDDTKSNESTTTHFASLLKALQSIDTKKKNLSDSMLSMVDSSKVSVSDTTVSTRKRKIDDDENPKVKVLPPFHKSKSTHYPPDVYPFCATRQNKRARAVVTTPSSSLNPLQAAKSQAREYLHKLEVLKLQYEELKVKTAIQQMMTDPNLLLLSQVNAMQSNVKTSKGSLNATANLQYMLKQQLLLQQMQATSSPQIQSTAIPFTTVCVSLVLFYFCLKKY